MRAQVEHEPKESRAARAPVLPPSAGTASPTEPRLALAGLLVRKEGWRASLRGKLLLLAVVFCLGVVLQRRIYPFLAITDRLPGKYLAVEGWIQADGLLEAYAEFKGGGYHKILTTGTIARSEWNPGVRSTYADWAASKYQRMGISNDGVEPVPCWVEHKDRTYSSALALKKWFQDRQITVRCINVVSQGPHARRTRLLFQKAFGNSVNIGIISLRDKEYDTAHWWRTSEGVRDIIGETIAYVYARIFFYPGTEKLEAGLSEKAETLKR